MFLFLESKYTSKKGYKFAQIVQKTCFAKDALMFKNANIIFVTIITTYLISFAMYRHFLIENVMQESCLQYTKCKIFTSNFRVMICRIMKFKTWYVIFHGLVFLIQKQTNYVIKHFVFRLVLHYFLFKA